MSKIKSLMLIVLMLFACASFGQTLISWDLPTPGVSTQGESITFPSLDSANDTYSDWNSNIQGFDGGTIYMSYQYNAVAADSCLIYVEAKINTLIIQVDTTIIITGASTPVPHQITLSLSGKGISYRLRFHNIAPTGQGAANAKGNSFVCGLVGTQNTVNTRKSWTKNYSN